MADRRKKARGADRRRAKRLEEEDEITLTVISAGNYPLTKKIIYNVSKDISDVGARIQSNTFLPVDALLNVQYTLKKQPQVMTAVGKVRWIKSIFADELYEAGLEFIQAPMEMI